MRCGRSRSVKRKRLQREKEEKEEEAIPSRVKSQRRIRHSLESGLLSLSSLCAQTSCSVDLRLSSACVIRR